MSCNDEEWEITTIPKYLLVFSVFPYYEEETGLKISATTTYNTSADMHALYHNSMKLLHTPFNLTEAIQF